ncbi:hypothetical protein [Aeromicrobium sp.]|uniref:hypothetical protein n=1 Tax=Aeromicrobium sp. TaxID=1871063 RepID=UPI002FC6D74B
MKLRQHPRRLLVALVVPLVLLTACGGSEGIPDDQELQPASAPSGWDTSTLDLLSLAAPPEWTKDASTSPEKGTTVTAWRTAPVDGQSSAGMEVREITKPDHDAETAAEALAVNAMATMQGGKPDTEQIVWPTAKDAWTFSNEIVAGLDSGNEQTYVSTTFVADLDDGTQVQVLVFTKKGDADDLGAQLLGTIKLMTADA